MIPLVTSPSSMTLSLKAYTSPSEREYELFGIEGEHDGVIEQVKRVARGFATRRSKAADKMFIAEAEAEAVFIVVELMYTAWDEIKEKYPDREERHKFFRMSAGYKLREYFSYRATSTVSFLKKKGIEVRFESIHESHIVRYDSDLLCYEILESVCKGWVERKVIEYYAMGNERDVIARKCSMTENRVKKIIRRVRRRLTNPVHE